MADSLERPEERNVRIDVGGPDVLSFRQIALLAAQAAGVRNLRCTYSRSHELASTTCTLTWHRDAWQSGMVAPCRPSGDQHPRSILAS